MTAPGLFDGIGGWAEGLRLIDPTLAAGHVGFEVDRWAVATARAAGHRSIRADVETIDLGHLYALGVGPVDGLTASPPCQAFSSAGKGEGRDLRPELAEAASEGRLRSDLPVKVRLVLEPLRWIAALRPGWVAMEQVPAVLPIWQAAAHWMRSLGYSAWAGVLNAADYGVPQTRRRALLLASLDRAVGCPPPTHGRDPQSSIFDQLQPWVTMADALGFPAHAVEVEYVRGSGMEERHGPRRRRPAEEPCSTIRGGTRGSGPNLLLHLRTNQNSNSSLADGYYKRSALQAGPTITGNGRSWHWEQGQDRRPITEAEALTIQSFRPDYPLQGLKGARFLQIGNAVPPLMVAHALAVVTGASVDLERAA